MGVDVATVKNLGEKQQTLRLCIDSDDSDVLEKMRKSVLELLIACQIRRLYQLSLNPHPRRNWLPSDASGYTQSLVI